MRAWILLLAVLATFQPFVQVASTEDTSLKFIKAISPPTTGAVGYRTDLTSSDAIAAANKIPITTMTRSLAITALADASHQPMIDDHTIKQQPTFKTTIDEQSESLSENIDNQNNNDINKQQLVIDTKDKNQVHRRTDQLDNLNKNQNHIIDLNSIDENSEKSKLNNSGKYEEHNDSSKRDSSEKPQDYSSNSDSVSYDISNNHNHINNNDNNIDNDIDNDDDDDEPATYSNKEIINEKVKPDPSTLVEIENSLLSLFNMKRPPKIDRSKIVIPEAMKQLYAQIMGHELDSVNIPRPGLLTRSANTVRSFTHKDSKIDDRFPHHHRFRLHFDINSIPAEEKLKAAELQLSRDAISHQALNPRSANRTRYQVLVYDITRVGVRGKREPSYLLLDSKSIRLNSTDTVSMDVQPAVERWLASPKRNYGLLVEVRTMRSLKPAPHHHVRLRRSADEPHDDWQHKQPLLFTYTDDGRHKSRSIRDVSTRSKRAGHNRRAHRRKNAEETCRRHALYVDFADVGWSDWIVAPPGYDAYYCHGKCPFPLADHLNSTNHAVVQTLVNNLNPGKVPKACCVPTQLDGISMLYLNDQSTVVLKNYQDMTVVGCGCR